MERYTEQNTVIQDVLDYSSKTLFPRTEVSALVDYDIYDDNGHVTGEKLINTIVIDGSCGMRAGGTIDDSEGAAPFLVGVIPGDNNSSKFFKIGLSTSDPSTNKFLNLAGQFVSVEIPKYEAGQGISLNEYEITTRIAEDVTDNALGYSADGGLYVPQSAAPAAYYAGNGLTSTTVAGGYTFSVKAKPGTNALTVSSDGLYVAPAEPAKTYSAGTAIGISSNNVISVLISKLISEDSGNGLVVKSGGLYITAAGETPEPIEYTAGNGISIENNVIKAVLYPSSTEVTNALTFRDGKLFVSAPGEAPEPIEYTAADESVVVTNSDGEHSIKANISTATNNALQLTDAGLSVACSSTAGNALTIDNNGLYVSKTSANTDVSDSTPYYIVGITSGDTTTFYADTSTNRGAYFKDGGLYAPSDERLKDIHENLAVNLDNLATIKKIKYTWKSDPNKVMDIGVTAQSVEALFPELVNTVGDKKAVQYSKLGVVALCAVDVMYAKMKKMEKRIKELESRLDELEA